jgi:predicted ABC-type ATPase
MAEPPLFVVLAGPNGSGKSTAASALLEPPVTFVNADEIAKGMPGYPSPAVDIEAGRFALQRMDELAALRTDFALETTLASRSLAPRIVRLRAEGYYIRLVFLFSPNPEFSVFRVASLVRSGGHGVPEETIRRRYRAGLLNFRDLHRPIVDRWVVYDNTREGEPRMIASGLASGDETIVDPALWARFRERLASDGP